MSMLINEAIEILKSRRMCAAYVDSEYVDSVAIEAVDTAISALEKQEGKKPIGTHYAHMRCPACNHRIPSGGGSSSRRRDNWCNYCGQRIDWSDEHGTD